MPKIDALQKIESHEKLCRIMQKQTHDKIQNIEAQLRRLERILLVSAGALISGMACMIFISFQNKTCILFKITYISLGCFGKAHFINCLTRRLK